MDVSSKYQVVVHLIQKTTFIGIMETYRGLVQTFVMTKLYTRMMVSV
jgi:hypothetical protein